VIRSLMFRIYTLFLLNFQPTSDVFKNWFVLVQVVMTMAEEGILQPTVNYLIQKNRALRLK